MPQFSCHPGYSGGALLAVATVSVLLIAVCYRRAFAALRPDQWVTLYLLRVATILIVLLLLFRPVFSIQNQQTRRRHVVFAVDTSASMGVADQQEGSTRLAQAVDRVATWQGELQADFDTEIVAFSDEAAPLADPSELVSLRADGEVTSLSRGLVAAMKVTLPRNIEAVFLLSDGIHNSAGDPLKAAAQMGIPIHTVGFGNVLRDAVSYRDVRVTGLEAPPQMAVNNRARVKGYVDAVGFPGRVVTVRLFEDQQQVDQQQLVIDDSEGAQEIAFEFIPENKGLHTYAVLLSPVSGERITENNRRTTSALVVDARIRVLYLEGTLRAEYEALVGRFLSKDPNVEFCALVQTRPNVFLQRSNIEDVSLAGIPGPAQLASFDVFLLGDLDSSYLQTEQMQAMAQRVRDGGGLLATGGYHSLGPGGYAETPLADLLPVVLGSREIGQLTEPFLPLLTPAGRQHPIFANITSFFPRQNGLPETAGLPLLDGCVRVIEARPSASVLATHPDEQTEHSAMPVMAVQPAGEGRVAVFTADTTRHWHQVLRTMDRETPFLRFWGQTVRWLAGRSDEFETEAGIAATTDKAHYEPEAAVTISATARGKDGEAAAQAQVVATVHGPDSEPLELNLSALSGPAGNYSATFEPQRSGRYDINVVAVVDETRLTAETIFIEVGRPNLEFDRLDLDETMLAAIAERSRGRYAHVATSDRLIDNLQRNQEKRLVRQEVSLAWPPLLWILFVAIISAEWLLRRKYHLR